MTSRLSLAARLHSIFALFAVLTTAITVLSDFNGRQKAELTAAIDTASHAAINVERVNADDAEQFATFRKPIEQFVDFRRELVRRAIEITPAAGREWGDNDANRAVRSALNKDLEVLSAV
jgi:methyl-accepting chemotaxis protein